MEINVKITAKKNMLYAIFFWQESENMEFCWLFLPFAKDLVLSFYLATWYTAGKCTEIQD